MDTHVCFDHVFWSPEQSASKSISSVHSSADVGFIEANKYLAIACSFLLGFGDACFNTQIFSILGSVYKVTMVVGTWVGLTMILVRRLPYMTSAIFSDFLTPSPSFSMSLIS